jgi:hypothetical protein
MNHKVLLFFFRLFLPGRAKADKTRAKTSNNFNGKHGICTDEFKRLTLGKTGLEKM